MAGQPALKHCWQAMPVLDIQRGLALYDWEQTTVMSYLDGNWSSLQRKLESMQQG